MDSTFFLYKTHIGRFILRPLISKPVSDLAGFILDRRESKIMIKPFAKKNNINLSDYILDDINSFNDFFSRKIKPSLRPVNMKNDNLIAPCDGLLSIHRIKKNTIYNIKQSKYTITSLLRDKKLAESFEDGYCLVYRLCVDNYHRYIYFDSGKKYKNRKIKGFYHTVRPVALEKYPVYVQNSREYSILDTHNFGRCVQMEVGAMLVGKIKNHHKEKRYILRGQEKGYFEYGGSTIIILIPNNKIKINDNILKSLRHNKEVPVKMGQVVGVVHPTIR